MHVKIEESLDIELLKQQAKNGVLNVGDVGSFVVDIMSQLCAPARDEQVAKLREITDTVQLFKEIYAIIGVMKVDMANFAIKSIRPHVQKHHIEYERSKFSMFVQKSPDGLNNTKMWLEKTYKQMQEQNQLSGSEDSISPMMILNTAYVQLLQDEEIASHFPETILLDKSRYIKFQVGFNQLILVSTLLLQIGSIIGQQLSSHKVLMNKLKDVIMTLSQPGDENASQDLTQILDSIRLQLWKELNDYSINNQYTLPSAAQESINHQVLSLNNKKDNNIYKIICKRALSYVQSISDIVSKNATSATPPRYPTPPPGLNFVGEEIFNLSVQYAKLVNLNRNVYGPFYVPILREILGVPALSPRDESGSEEELVGNNILSPTSRRKLDLD